MARPGRTNSQAANLRSGIEFIAGDWWSDARWPRARVAASRAWDRLATSDGIAASASLQAMRIEALAACQLTRLRRERKRFSGS